MSSQELKSPDYLVPAKPRLKEPDLGNSVSAHEQMSRQGNVGIYTQGTIAVP